jgi:hypothetical protein
MRMVEAREVDLARRPAGFLVVRFFFVGFRFAMIILLSSIGAITALPRYAFTSQRDRLIGH